MVQYTTTATETATSGSGATTTTTTTTTHTLAAYSCTRTASIPGAAAEVFDYYAGAWAGPEIHKKNSIWGTIEGAPDNGGGTFALKLIETPAGDPGEGRTREVLNSPSGLSLVETLYSVNQGC